MSVATVTRVDVCCDAFAQHHGLVVPRAGAALDLGGPGSAGGFGVLRPVTGVDGKRPAKPGVAKVLHRDQLIAGGGAAPIIDTLGALYASLENSGVADWADQILALPYAMLTVQLDGEERLISLMLDLGAVGYVDSGLAETTGLAAYARLPVTERIVRAVNCLRRLELLERARFIHADLNPQNLLINPGTGDVQVIDFDSGVVLATGSERPRTCGKPDAFMPPEVKVPGAVGFDTQLYTAGADRWSYAALAGLLTLGVHPVFFLQEISPASIQAYAMAPERWPDIDQTGPLFTQSDVNRRVYQRMRNELKSVPADVRDLFARCFDAGLDGDRRPTAAEWVAALAGLRNPPTIDTLDVGALLVLEGDDVLVTWATTNANEVELIPGGKQPANGSLRLRVDRSLRVTVVARNPFGDVRGETELVRAVPLPVLREIAMPQLPPTAIPQVPRLAPFRASDRTQGVAAARFGAARTRDQAVPELHLPAPPDLDAIWSQRAALTRGALAHKSARRRRPRRT